MLLPMSLISRVDELWCASKDLEDRGGCPSKLPSLGTSKNSQWWIVHVNVWLQHSFVAIHARERHITIQHYPNRNPHHKRMLNAGSEPLALMFIYCMTATKKNFAGHALALGVLAGGAGPNEVPMKMRRKMRERMKWKRKGHALNFALPLCH